MSTSPSQPGNPTQTDATLWHQAMLRGDFEQAWLASDRIRAGSALDPHRFWQGETIADKRVIVRCLHGFGDALQFLRYLPRLQRTASHVTVEVAPRLVELARCLDGITEVITWGDAAPPPPPPLFRPGGGQGRPLPFPPPPPPPFDVQVEVMELPYLFRTQPADLPLAERYLRLPTPPPLPPTQNRRIGIVLSAGSWNPTRALPLELLAPILEAPRCDFWNLSPHDGPAALLEAPGARTNLLTLASVVSQMDLVLTPDTLAAHLAGALGVPAWVLLQHTADWRWQHTRTDSPWYPSLRLFRQPTQGDWPAIIHTIAQELTGIGCPIHRSFTAMSGKSTTKFTPKTIANRPWDSFAGYLFDIDGTLMNCQDAVHYFAFCEALTAIAGRPMNLDGVTTHGNVDNGILRDALALAHIPESHWRPRLPETQAQMGRFVEANKADLSTPTLPCVPELLEHLAGKGAVLGTATGNFEQIGKLKLANAGILDFFTVGGWSDPYETRTEVFRAALAAMRAATSPDAPICVLGDTPADIHAAHANGLPVIAVATGIYPAEALREAGADLVLDSFEDLFK